MMEYGHGHYGLSPSKCIYGSGVHLAAVTPPYVCLLNRDVDENEIKHLVLCRVIMGNMELLRPGSDQLRPSGCEYDNGVNDILNPNYYVVWNMNMNTHIYPEFVVSFKAPKAKATNVPAEIKRTPSSRWIPFSTLFATIGNMSKKISRDVFDEGDCWG